MEAQALEEIGGRDGRQNLLGLLTERFDGCAIYPIAAMQSNVLLLTR